ncbi:MAG TPA: DUF2127 domain-containing protein [Streptosporangiaceae bacterium]|jgi:uncharacterized membrane protein (DUF2068 family)
MDWSLLSCGRGGHVTYAPDEPAVRRRLRAATGDGEAWRCLRCAAFVPGPPGGHGPAAGAPRVRRGKEVRSALILRIFAVERFLRALIFAGAAYGVWRFSYSHSSLEATFDRAVPALRRLYQDLGFNFSHSKLAGLVQHALAVNSHTLRLLAVGLAVYAVIELVEGTGLWLVKRWGEYFAMVATSIFLPYEIYDLTAKVTALRLVAFLINLALVVYLVVSKRLFGVRGGKRAYEERLRENSVIDQAAEAAAREADAAGEGGAGGAGAKTPGARRLRLGKMRVRQRRRDLTGVHDHGPFAA